MMCSNNAHTHPTPTHPGQNIVLLTASPDDQSNPFSRPDQLLRSHAEKIAASVFHAEIHRVQATLSWRNISLYDVGGGDVVHKAALNAHATGAARAQ